jgi:outer membrane autotransporter protein
MNRRYKTVFNRCLGVWQVASELTRAKGKATKGGAGKKPFMPNKAILVEAVGSAILLVGAMSSMHAYADTIIGTGTTSGYMSIGTGTTTNIEVDSGGTIYFSNMALQNNGGLISTLSNSGMIYGDSSGIANDRDLMSVPMGVGTISTLINNAGGTIYGGTYGINNSSAYIGTLSNSGLISSTLYGVYNGYGTVSLIENNSGGTISATSAIENVSGIIGTISNSGLITSPSVNGGIAIYNNSGTISLIQNNAGGTISAGSAIQNNTGGTIGTISNSGLITSTSSSGYAIYNDSNISLIENNHGATISAVTAILNSGGTIGTISNSGLITSTSSSARYGIHNNGGTISLIQNNAGGTISAVTAIQNISATIGTISNSGLIAGTLNGSGIGISNIGGSISLIENNVGGTIIGTSTAISMDSTSSIGRISNSGLIAGNIINDSSHTLTITGNTVTGAFGTLTGYSGGLGINDMGSISNTLSNLRFASGNILLNDNINVGSHTVTIASGANLALNNLVTITGNYSQYGTLTSNVSDSATVNGDFFNDSGYGRLYVTGTATLESGASVVLARTSYAFVSGQRFVVIEGNSSSTYNTAGGTFSASGYSGTVTASQVADGSSQALVLSLSGGSSSGDSSADSITTTPRSGLATTSVAISSLKGLTNYGGIANGLLDLYDAALAINSTAEANRIGAQLAPTQNFSAGNATSTATFDALSVVGAHVDAIRLASASGVATGERATDWAVWGQLYGGHAHQGMVDAVSGYASTYGGLVLGADRALADHWRTGAAFSYNNAAIYGSDYLTGNASHVNSYGLIGYASYTGEPWYVNLSASAALQKYNTSRVISLTGFYGDAEGRFNGTQYVAKAEFGYPLALPNGFTATPIAALSYSYQKQNGYTETGGNGAALSVDGTHANALRSSVGGKLEKAFEASYGTLVPFAQVMWTHQYNGGRTSTTASYVADTTGATDFTIVGAAPERNIGELRLGANVLRSDNLSISLRYDLQAASSYLSQALSLRLRKSF